MRVIVALLIITVGPLFIAWLCSIASPDEYRLPAILAGYFLSAFCAVTLAAEFYYHKLASLADVVVSVRAGSAAFAACGAVILSLIGLAWLSAKFI